MIMIVFAGIAVFERDLIRERTGAGREAAKKRGVLFGLPPKAFSFCARQPLARNEPRERKMQSPPKRRAKPAQGEKRNKWQGPALRAGRTPFMSDSTLNRRKRSPTRRRTGVKLTQINTEKPED